MAPSLAPFDASDDADLTLRTPDGTTFQVYSRFLAVASPVFHDMCKLPQPDADKNTSIPVVDVSERSEVMDALLRFIYPIKDPPVKTLSMLSDVLAAADKYNMISAIQTLGRLLIFPPIFVDKEPVRVYAIACRYGLEEAAKVAASRSLTTDILCAPLMPELKWITAHDYQRLISLHQTHSHDAQKILEEFKWSGRCSQCQLVPSGGMGDPDPSIMKDWLIRAKEELRLRPTTEVIFSLSFFWMGKRNCTRCRRFGMS